MSEMQRLIKLGKYSVSFAGDRFKYQGIWIWTGKRNLRIIPFNRFNNWTGREDV